jgi:hypothetical protein
VVQVVKSASLGGNDSFEICLEQKVEPAKQAKVMQEFQKQSAQISMTVSSHPTETSVMNFCQIRFQGYYFAGRMLGWSDPCLCQHLLLFIVVENMNLQWDGHT